MSAEALAIYLKYNAELHQLYIEGKDETPEGEEIADGLNDLWKDLTTEERQEVRDASAARKEKEIMTSLPAIFEPLNGRTFLDYNAVKEAIASSRRNFRDVLPPSADVEALYNAAQRRGWVTSEGPHITFSLPRMDYIREVFLPLEGKVFATWKDVKEHILPTLIAFCKHFPPLFGAEGAYDEASRRRWVVHHQDGGLSFNLSPVALPSETEKAIAVALDMVQKAGIDGRLDSAKEHMLRAQELVRGFYRR